MRRGRFFDPIGFIFFSNLSNNIVALNRSKVITREEAELEIRSMEVNIERMVLVNIE